jgi:hypothetical protein
MEPNLKLDSNLLQALHREADGQRLFGVLIGLDRGHDDVLKAAYLRHAQVSRIGPRTATGMLTRQQLYKVAEQPAVKYLKLIERLVASVT